MGFPVLTPITRVLRAMSWGGLGLGQPSSSDFQDSSGSLGIQAKPAVRCKYCSYVFIIIHRDKKNGATIFLPLTLPNADRISNFLLLTDSALNF